MSRQTAFCGISGAMGFHYKEKNDNVEWNTSMKFLVDILNQEVKSVVLEKHEFWSRENISGFFGLTRNFCRNQIDNFWTECSLKSRSYSIARLLEQIKPVVIQENVWKKKFFSTLNFLAVLNYQDSNSGNEINNFGIESSWKKRRRYIEQEIKTVFIENYQLEIRKNVKSNSIC